MMSSPGQAASERWRLSCYPAAIVEGGCDVKCLGDNQSHVASRFRPRCSCAIIWTFPDIYKAIEKILTTETVSKLKGPGFEVDLNETNVNDALLQQSVATDSQSPVFPAMVPSRVVLGFGDASPSLVMLSDHEARSMI
jgi:hypothetical protein